MWRFTKLGQPAGVPAETPPQAQPLAQAPTGRISHGERMSRDNVRPAIDLKRECVATSATGPTLRQWLNQQTPETRWERPQTVMMVFWQVMKLIQEARQEGISVPLRPVHMIVESPSGSLSPMAEGAVLKVNVEEASQCSFAARNGDDALEQQWYSPPRGRGLSSLQQSDSYCLGVLLYELCFPSVNAQVRMLALNELKQLRVSPDRVRAQPCDAAKVTWLLEGQPSFEEIRRSDLFKGAESKGLPDGLSIAPKLAHSEVLVDCLGKMHSRESHEQSRLLMETEELTTDIDLIQQQLLRVRMARRSNELRRSMDVRRSLSRTGRASKGDGSFELQRTSSCCGLQSGVQRHSAPNLQALEQLVELGMEEDRPYVPAVQGDDVPAPGEHGHRRSLSFNKRHRESASMSIDEDGELPNVGAAATEHMIRAKRRISNKFHSFEDLFFASCGRSSMQSDGTLTSADGGFDGKGVPSVDDQSYTWCAYQVPEPPDNETSPKGERTSGGSGSRSSGSRGSGSSGSNGAQVFAGRRSMQVSRPSMDVGPFGRPSMALSDMVPTQAGPGLSGMRRVVSYGDTLEGAGAGTGSRPSNQWEPLSSTQWQKTLHRQDSGGSSGLSAGGRPERGGSLCRRTLSIDEPAGRARTEQLDAFGKKLSSFSRYSDLEVLADLKNSTTPTGADMVCSSGFDRDDEFFATVGVSKRIKVFEYERVLSPEVDVHCPVLEMASRSKLSSVCWSSYIKSHLASSDYEGTVTLWDVSHATPVMEYEEHKKRAWSVDVSMKDPNRLLSGSDDGTVKLWHTAQQASVATILGKANVCCVQFSPTNSNMVVFGTADYKLYVYDLRSLKAPQHVLSRHSKTVSYVRFLGDSRLVSASTDSTLKLWDLNASAESPEPGVRDQGGTRTLAPAMTLRGHVNEKNFVGLSLSESGYIACGSEDNKVYTYHNSLPWTMATHSFKSDRPSMDAAPHARDKVFVSTVCWKRKGNILLAGNSAGHLKILSLK